MRGGSVPLLALDRADWDDDQAYVRGKRDYNYPELSCPQAVQPLALPSNWASTLSPFFSHLDTNLTDAYLTTGTAKGTLIRCSFRSHGLDW
jgi:hypothetical protein